VADGKKMVLSYKTLLTTEAAAYGLRLAVYS